MSATRPDKIASNGLKNATQGILTADEIEAVGGGGTAPHKERIRRGLLLYACGLSQEQVARVCKVDRVTVARWVARHRDAIRQIQTRRAEYINQLHGDTLVLLANTALDFAARAAVVAPKPAEFLAIVKAVEAIGRTLHLYQGRHTEDIERVAAMRKPDRARAAAALKRLKRISGG